MNNTGHYDPAINDDPGWRRCGEPVNMDDQWVDDVWGESRRGEPGKIPTGFPPVEPEIRERVEASGRALIRQMKTIEQREGGQSPDEQRLADFIELKKHMRMAETLKTALPRQPDDERGAQLTKAARNNHLRISAIAGRVLGDPTHPMARANTDESLEDTMHEAGRTAQRTRGDEGTAHWATAYREQHGTHASLRFLTENPEIEDELRRKAGGAKAKRVMTEGFKQSHENAKQNFGDSVAAGLSGVTHDDDFKAALDILKTAFNTVRGAWPGGVGTVSAVVSAAIAPAWHAMMNEHRDTDHERRHRVGTERPVDTIDTELARAMGENVPHHDTPKAQAAHADAQALQSAFGNVEAPLARRLASQMADDARRTGETLDPASVDFAALSGRPKAQRLDAQTLVNGGNERAGESLEAALRRGGPLPPHVEKMIDTVENAAGAESSKGQTASMRCRSAASALAHLQDVEHAFERFADAGIQAKTLKATPELAAALKTSGMEGPKAITDMMETFANMRQGEDTLSCAQMRSRIQSTWATLHPNGKRWLAGLTPPIQARGKNSSAAPNEENGYGAEPDTKGGARWLAHAGTQVKSRVDKASQIANEKAAASRSGFMRRGTGVGR